MNVWEFPLHFLRPWWWLGLAPLPLALWLVARGGGGRAALARLADAVLLPHLVHAAGSRKRLALVVLALAWLLAVTALAGPAWQKVQTPLYVNGAARVVVLSLSNDMLAEDLKPDRMTRARFAVRDLLDAAGDARTALVAYAGAAFTVAPLTDDKRTVLNLLQALRPDVMPVQGNDAAAGIRQGVELLRQAHVKGGDLVVVTDTAGDAAVAAARSARNEGIRVDVLGIGTREGAPVPQTGGGFASGTGGMLMARRDDAALRVLANAGGGRYVALQADGGGVTAFAAPLAASGHVSDNQRAQLWRDGGVWLLPILVVLAALAFRRGWLLVLALCVLPISMPVAHASTWSSLWTNRDQRAVQALREGDATRAKALATTSGMRGAADYRSGDFGAAAKAFAQQHDARARYNLGNALAKQGDYQKAIDAYSDALRQDPELADARANRDAVQDWLKQHAPPPQQQGNQQGKSQQQAGQRNQPGAGQSQAQDHAAQQKPESHPPTPSQATQGKSSPTSSGQKSAGPGSSATPQDQAGKNGSSGDQAAAEAARQEQQAERARQALRQTLQETRRENSKPGSDKAGAFALGQAQPREDSKLDAQQRAMLRAVPDDPGALLRRKFQLEWQQRNGAEPQENGQ